ncbi:MAG TPA: glutamine-hydrolyzing carbamoyl-phosphate synthase small subunit [Synergistaceae bacterium]|nr:glutamine-hydrolyzing carbamoyl-phosphate synthase small subunit [Synergistaceae bacterium]HQH78895.1 glutamine-hydrolyzing carbamoyl-phosphate synthase small subunit [Synergistaceae bacterium]
MQELWLTLEDGSSWKGWGEPPVEGVEGEVVFTTAAGGYPQALSDPSYCGQMVLFAFPPAGIYGVDLDALESSRPWATAALVGSLERAPGRNVTQLAPWLAASGVPLVAGMDTRGLVRHLRSRGTLRGRLAKEVGSPALPVSQDAVRRVSPARVTVEGSGSRRVGVLDCGVKEGILRHLRQEGWTVVRFPSATPPEEILSWGGAGLILSNGPGDPLLWSRETATVRHLLGRIPIFGICLGCQILARACGGNTEKLPFGHRGVNQPVVDLSTGRGFVTSQNHGYAVNEASLTDTELAVTFRHLGDGSVEGLRHRRVAAEGVQFHPEASPGPRDALFLLDRFLASLSGENGHA